MILTNSDFTGKVSRGDSITVGTETHVISKVTSDSVNNTAVTLESTYYGTSGNVAVHKIAECSTGSYVVDYNPVVTGNYTIIVAGQVVGKPTVTPGVTDAQTSTIYGDSFSAITSPGDVSEFYIEAKK